jgi:hypothetical protein
VRAVRIDDHRDRGLGRSGGGNLGEVPLRPRPCSAVEALLETVAQDRESKHQTDWAERDLAFVLTSLLAGLPAEELGQANVGDIRSTADGAAVIHVKGKGGKERSVPIETELLSVIEAYLDSRTIRFPDARKHKPNAVGSSLSQWPAKSPLFVGRDGDRITRKTLQSRIERAFKRAGPDAQPVPRALESRRCWKRSQLEPGLLHRVGRQQQSLQACRAGRACARTPAKGPPTGPPSPIHHCDASPLALVQR